MGCSQKESLLDKVVIARPCSVPWSDMVGSDTERLCSGCAKNVYNLSDMTRNEVDAFLEKSGFTQCMTFYRRQDGTIMTDNCPRPLRKLRDASRAALAFATSAIALVLPVPGFWGQAANAQATKGETLPKKGTPVPPKPPGPDAPPMLGGEPMPPPSMRTGGAVALPPNPGRMAIPPVKPPVKPLQPTKPETGTLDGPKSKEDAVKLRIQKNVYMDTRAHDFFQKGQAAFEQGHSELALFYYDKALEAYDTQKMTGDLKFRQEIEKAKANASSK